MYKLTNSKMVERVEDGAQFPQDPGNTDYQAYQAWIAAGNTPLPADQPTAAQQWAAYQAGAKTALEASSVTLERVAEGVSVGTCAWTNADVVAFMNWRKQLRAILTEAQPATIPTALPAKPAYPAGT